jgi:hypothetical protein
MSENSISSLLPQRQADRSSLLSKHGAVMVEIAREILALSPGNRLSTVRQFANRLGVSIGTVQIALRSLVEKGAIAPLSRGRSNSILQGCDYPLLWTISIGRPLVGLMPLPWSRRVEGLATATRRQFDAHPIDLSLRFMRGSLNRMQALTSLQCDWAVSSRFAAETAHAHGFYIDIIHSFGPESFSAKHAIVFRNSIGTDLGGGLRVGIDNSSLDHAFMIHSVCNGKNVILVDIKYSQGLKLLASKQIDATIWSQEDVPIEMEARNVIPLNHFQIQNFEWLDEATFFVRHGDVETANVLRDVLNLDNTRKIQMEVVALAQSPDF